MLDEFVLTQLSPYKQLFAPNMLYHSIEHTERRWAWFKRLLKSIDHKFSNIWPSHWDVPKLLCIAFLEVTRDHTVSMLKAYENDENKDVSVLLKALQTTLRFEQEMESKFGSSTKTPRKIRAENPFADEDLDTEKPDVKQEPEFSAKNTVSAEYDNFLSSYVSLERQNLDEMLEGLKQQEDTVVKTEEEEYSTITKTKTNTPISGVSKANVYDSSIQMFVFIKNSIKRCTTLTTGNTFLALSYEFKRSLKQYSESLKAKCTNAMRTPTAELTICYLINTAEYCADVVPRLESMIRSKIKEDLSEKVALAEELKKCLTSIFRWTSPLRLMYTWTSWLNLSSRFQQWYRRDWSRVINS